MLKNFESRFRALQGSGTIRNLQDKGRPESDVEQIVVNVTHPCSFLFNFSFDLLKIASARDQELDEFVQSILDVLLLSA